jgi:succinoglycan biosynthesis transport protein ExoP
MLRQRAKPKAQFALQIHMVKTSNDQPRLRPEVDPSVADGISTQIHFLDYWRVIRLRLPVVTLVFFLCVITAGVFTHTAQRLYQASVLLEVEQQNQDVFIFTDSGGRESFRSDPRFATTQFQVLQRKEMLYPVIDGLGLVEKWGKQRGVRSRENAYGLLRQMLDVREVRNTNLLQITVESSDPLEAATLANFIADSYQALRDKSHRDTIGAALSVLKEEVSKQRERVVEAELSLAKIRSDLRINDLNPDSKEDPKHAHNEVFLESEKMAVEAESKLGKAMAQYAQIEKLDGRQLIDSLHSLEIDDQVVESILPQYQEVEAEIARQSNSGLGALHPQIKSLEAKREAYSRQLGEQALGIRRALRANLDILEKSAANMRKNLAAAEVEAGEAKNKSAEYGRAKREYIQAKKILEEVELRLSRESMQRSMPLSPARIWERAEPPRGPISPNGYLNMMAGVILGLVLGIGAAFFLEYLDTSVKTVAEVESQLGLPVLATIPQGSVLLSGTSDQSMHEPYRMLKVNIEFNQRQPRGRSFVFTSGLPGEGKSTTVANLATVFAQGGYRTLVVDADLRRPVQDKLWKLPAAEGLTECLLGEVRVAGRAKKTDNPNLEVLCSGAAQRDPAGLLNSQRMVDLINEMRMSYDVVLVDAPPILGLSDAGILARACDYSIIVAQHRKYPGALLKRVKSSVESVGGKVLGVVLNNANLRYDENIDLQSQYYARSSSLNAGAVVKGSENRTGGSGGRRVLTPLSTGEEVDLVDPEGAVGLYLYSHDGAKI